MKIVVLAGGTSTERDVSYSSGRKIYSALREKGHKVILVDVYMGTTIDCQDIFDLDYDWIKGIADIDENAPSLELIKSQRDDGGSSYFGKNVLEICKRSDIVFLALHGENGENGKLQAAFDLLGIKYTGTDYLGSALAMNKLLAKQLFIANGIKTPRFYILDDNISIDNNMEFPRVVKVSCGGSSIGVFITNTKEEYRLALNEAGMIDKEILVEEYIDGREFSVGIIGGEALPVIEIIPKDGFYNYKSKYQSGYAMEVCPAHLSIEKTDEIQKLAQRVYHALKLKVYARIDFIISNKTGEIYCLEANTLPGMTPTSLIPQEALAIGLSFSSLCEKIIELSLKK